MSEGILEGEKSLCKGQASTKSDIFRVTGVPVRLSGQQQYAVCKEGHQMITGCEESQGQNCILERGLRIHVEDGLHKKKSSSRAGISGARWESKHYPPIPIGIIKQIQKETFYITVGNQDKMPSTYQKALWQKTYLISLFRLI